MTPLGLRHLALLLLAVTTVACGDDADDGAGDANAYGDEPVLGTRHDGDCATDSEFDAQCEAEGGVLTEPCTYSTCAGVAETCAPPPPALDEGQFLCGEVEVCGLGQLCISSQPLMDGCVDHRCALVPGACAETPTCDCILENTTPASMDSQLSCAEVDGHFLVEDRN